MLNSIKTEDQRMTVEIGMDCIMPRIEIANDILYDAWEEFFGDVPQQSISALEAEHLGRILYAAVDMASNAIREYHLMLGHHDLDTVKRFMENAEHIAKTIEAKKAIETMRKEKRFDDVEKAMTLDNEAVIKLLTSKEVDNTNVFAVVFKQPLLERNKTVVKGREPFLVVTRHNIFAGNDCSDEKSFVNIDTTTDWICELHIVLRSEIKEAVTAPPHNKHRSI